MDDDDDDDDVIKWQEGIFGASLGMSHWWK